MDSVPLEMDDIFGNYEEAEDFNPSRLPDLEDELEPMRDVRSDEDNDGEDMAAGDQDNIDDPELLAKLKSMKGASKHTTRKSYPKLDSARLTGERGIPVLPKIFKDIPLKGKNHEAEDLKIIMCHLEHWAHRLFPKMPLDEVLDRTERLGSQKDVQSCVKRIRLDMPVLMSDYVEEHDDVNRTGPETGGEDEVERVGISVSESQINEDEIEELLREQEEITCSQAAPLQNSEASSKLIPPTPPQTPQGMSEEVRKRIERNKQIAMEKRAARLAKINQGNTNSEVQAVREESHVTENNDPQVVGEESQSKNNSDAQDVREMCETTGSNDPQLVREEGQSQDNSDSQIVRGMSETTENKDPEVVREDGRATEGNSQDDIQQNSDCVDVDGKTAAQDDSENGQSGIMDMNSQSRSSLEHEMESEITSNGQSDKATVHDKLVSAEQGKGVSVSDKDVNAHSVQEEEMP